MKNKIKLLILALSCWLLTSPVFAFDLGTKNFFDNPPPAILVYPAKEEANLRGKDSLEFEWSDNCTIETEGYEFKLYKDYKMDAANLIYKENLSARTISAKISADKFKDEQVYTWSIKRIANCGRKSDPAYNSFRVKK